MKAIFELELPENCIDCPLFDSMDDNLRCKGVAKGKGDFLDFKWKDDATGYVETVELHNVNNGRAEFCPLKTVESEEEIKNRKYSQVVNSMLGTWDKK